MPHVPLWMTLLKWVSGCKVNLGPLSLRQPDHLSHEQPCYKILTYLSCVQYLYYWSSQKNVAGHTQVLTFLSNSIYYALYSRLMKSVNFLHYKIVTQKMAKRHLSFVNCHFDDVTFTEGRHITDKMKPNRARENEQLSQNMHFCFSIIPLKVPWSYPHSSFLMYNLHALQIH